MVNSPVATFASNGAVTNLLKNGDVYAVTANLAKWWKAIFNFHLGDKDVYFNHRSMRC
jgi:hypothetical protein